MSQPINLNRARKDRARKEKKAKADANAAKFGRTKAQKQAQDTTRDMADRHIDAHKLDTDEEDGR
ncbi:MAG: DUF4169 family protein [Pseudomonadota bacterium]